MKRNPNPFRALLLALCCLAALPGCATFTAPENEIRITEYEGSGKGGWPSWLGGEAIAGGVRVVEEGNVRACVTFAGDYSTVRAGTCAGDAPAAPPGAAVGSASAAIAGRGGGSGANRPRVITQEALRESGP